MALLLLVSCRPSPLAKYGSTFEQIVKLDTGLFRGFSIGTDEKTVRAIETKGLQEEDSDEGIDYLYYEFGIDSTLNYSIAYYFPDKHLNSIEVDVNLKNKPAGADLFNAFKSYYESKYGKALEEGDFCYWTVTSANGSKAKIELSDESPTYNEGKLTLVIHEDSE